MTSEKTPWCEPCQSYHHPSAPGCFRREPTVAGALLQGERPRVPMTLATANAIEGCAQDLANACARIERARASSFAASPAARRMINRAAMDRDVALGKLATLVLAALQTANDRAQPIEPSADRLPVFVHTEDADRYARTAGVLCIGCTVYHARLSGPGAIGRIVARSFAPDPKCWGVQWYGTSDTTWYAASDLSLDPPGGPTP